MDRMSIVSRRTALVAGAATLGAATTVGGRALAAVRPRVIHHPVLADKVALLGVDLPGRTAVVTSRSGRVLGRGEVVDGRALVVVDAPKGSTRRLRFVSGDHDVTVSTSTKQRALRHSPWIVTNKRHPLPAGFEPVELDAADGYELAARAAKGYRELAEAARRRGFSPVVVSGYRSFEYQKGTYAHWVSVYGRKGADAVSARPGHSEHQTGLAVDIGNADGWGTLDESFAGTPLGAWAAENATKHGFVVRYEKTETKVTGYDYEPWHLRYVGEHLAADYSAREASSLEEYFGLDAAPDYRA